jgi:hypothetical protein
MAQEDDDRLRAWRGHGFSDEEARAWLALVPQGRFTPHTAREWIEQGFGPADAAEWSERFSSPAVARMEREIGGDGDHDETGAADDLDDNGDAIRAHDRGKPVHPPSFTTWRTKGFTDGEAMLWIACMPNRFTAYTAREWKDAGFGPADAALWSEVFANPEAARARRQAGWDNPFPDLKVRDRA